MWNLIFQTRSGCIHFSFSSSGSTFASTSFCQNSKSGAPDSKSKCLNFKFILLEKSNLGISTNEKKILLFKFDKFIWKSTVVKLNHCEFIVPSSQKKTIWIPQWKCRQLSEWIIGGGSCRKNESYHHLDKWNILYLLLTTEANCQFSGKSKWW